MKKPLSKSEINITFVNSEACGIAISCFVSDNTHNEQFTYGAAWRSYLGTYYSSAN